MRISLLAGAIGLAAAAAAPVRAGVPPAMTDLVKTQLVAETASVAPGQTLWLALQLRMKPGWHTYWRNPGDAGLPTAIAWTLPPGFSAGAIRWPVPQRIVSGSVGDYGYTGEADLLVPITAPQDVAPGGTVHLQAKASWLVCSDICIPGDRKIALSLPVTATAAPNPPAAPLFAEARARLPRPASFTTRFAAAGKAYRLAVPAAALAGLRDPAATFFPYGGSAIDHAAPERSRSSETGLEVTLKRASGEHDVPKRLDGVLLLQGDGGAAHAFVIGATRVAALPGEAQPDPAIGWWQALLLAFVGGMILNLMPCVFPILSLKVLSLAAPAHAERSERHHYGLAYSAGVIGSFVVLGGALLALRAAGAAVGWGFQLQSPVVVALLAYLLFAMGLSLSGVAEFGGALAGVGTRLADRPGLAGAFFTGILAAVVATPCTAPFMGAALGFALIAPAPIAIGIFLALGAGLAAPFLAATMLPGLHRALPRPGPWMVLVKQLLAFPLYGTVAWLVWVLIQETGAAGSFAALIGLVLVAFAVWVYGRAQQAGSAARFLGNGLAAAGTAAAILLAATMTPLGAGAAPAAPATGAGLRYEPYTAARLAALSAAHRPVFVDLTASWCLTCLFNERTVLDSAPVRKAFETHGIVALKGDWTRRDPQITSLLLRFGRSGVPLYLLYDGKGMPRVLPQILTESTVLSAVARL